jgi:hypothetical protein
VSVAIILVSTWCWRERLHRGAAVYPVEVDGTTFDLMQRFGGLKADKVGDRQAVAIALGKLLRLALAALLREETGSRLPEAKRRAMSGGRRTIRRPANARAEAVGAACRAVRLWMRLSSASVRLSSAISVVSESTIFSRSSLK